MKYYRTRVALSTFLFLCLAVVSFADNEGTACVNAQLNIVGQQDLPCDIDSPFCVYGAFSGSTPRKQCEYCAVMLGQPTYGGSCNCDPTLYYCEQSNDLSGACYPYTRLNQFCSSDATCQTTTTRILPSGSSVTITNEKLFCINNVCKPCNPTEWEAQIGTLGVATLTCAGYNAQISTNIGRYATTTRLSGASYTCMANGDFVWVNATVDYNYQYSCGDRSQWPADCGGNTPTPSVAPNSSPTSTPNGGGTSDASALEWLAVFWPLCFFFVFFILLNE